MKRTILAGMALALMAAAGPAVAEDIDVLVNELRYAPDYIVVRVNGTSDHTVATEHAQETAELMCGLWDRRSVVVYTTSAPGGSYVDAHVACATN